MRLYLSIRTECGADFAFESARVGAEGERGKLHVFW